ncbi:MAG TPA: hypothetical protein VHZ25_10685 [Acidobacteriaceae bacterium]|jgi:hypothetical protein|nr:hypothetical protein [Acidobacteriaceae bacterium]
MPSARNLILLLALLLPASLSAQQPPIVLPLDYSGHHLYLTVTDDHLGPLTLMLDTGFARTSLAASVASKGEVHTSFWRRSISWNGFGTGPSKHRYQTADVSLRSGQTSLFTGSALVADFDDFAKELGHPVDGFLGWDFLQKWCATLDYAPARLTLRDPAHCSPPSAPYATLNGQWSTQGFLLPSQLTFANGHSATALLHFDTGSDATLFLNTPFRAIAGLEPSPAAATGSRGWGVNGHYSSDTVPLAQFTLEEGHLHLDTGKNTTIAIARPGAFSTIHWWEGPSAVRINHDGIIGSALLERLSWTFDPAAKRVYASLAGAN